MGSIFSNLLEYLFSKKLEICLLGLENTGKTTFVDCLMGIHKQNLPTIGLNVKQVKKGSKNKYNIILIYI
jgi:ABC-type cobalamin/Fe3+-siderophores transport system ATPase subunit